MNSTSFERLKQIFSAAVELPPAKRAAFLDAQPDIDHHTRRQLDDWLSADADLQDDATRRAAIEDARQARSQEWSGRRIGTYRVERALGHGGMGSVFLAHRVDDSLEQKVAIKVIRPEMLGAATLARFRLERQVLALLQHPNVPRMLDTGELAGGEPYVVMEYIAGEPIDRYAQQRSLDITQRLRLFLQICDAVAYAHRNLIVHRDLKPANVLVDASGRPQLLDFGIAKPLQRQLGAIDAVETGLADRFLSPTHAAPEQLRGAAITTGCDVYALGVMLYELLAGAPPFAADSVTPAELERRICEDDPPPPSHRALQRDERASGLRIEPDLELIVLRCLRKEPANRYGSAEALAEDLQRYLQGLPVQARQGNFWYRASRFVRRHRAGVTAAAFAAVVAIAGSALLWHQQLATLAERSRADEMTGLITDALQSIDPASRTARDMTAREMFERIAAQTQADPSLSATSRARILGTVAEVLFTLGQLQSADKVFAQVDLSQLDTSRRHEVFADKARALLALTKFDEARAIIDRENATEGADNAYRNALQMLSAEVDYREGKNEAAWAAIEKLRVDQMTPSQIDRYYALRTTVLWELNRRDESIAEASRLIAAQRARLGDDSPAVYDSLRLRAILESRRGNYAERNAISADLLVRAEKLYGRNSTHYAQALSLEAMSAIDRGDRATANEYGEKALAIIIDQTGASSEETAKRHINLASTYEESNLPDKAYPHYRRAHDIAQGIWGSHDTNLLLFRTAFATFLALQERSDELEPVVAAARRDLAANPQLEARDLVTLIDAAYAMDQYRRERTSGRRKALDDAIRACKSVCEDDPEVKKAFDAVLAKAKSLGVDLAS